MSRDASALVALLLPVLRGRGPPAVRGDARGMAVRVLPARLRAAHGEAGTGPRADGDRAMSAPQDEWPRLGGSPRRRRATWRGQRRSRCCAGPSDTFGDGLCVSSSMTDAVLAHLAGRARPGVDGVLPGHRLPLRRDDRHPGRGRRDAAGQRAHGPAAWTVAEQDADLIPGCTTATPTGAAGCARWSRWAGRWRRSRAWVSGVRRDESPTRRTRGGRSGTPGGRSSRCTRWPAGPRTTWTPTSPSTACWSTRCVVRRLPLDRLRALHGAGRAGRRPALRALGRQRQDRVRDPQCSGGARPAAAPASGGISWRRVGEHRLRPGEGGGHPRAGGRAVRRAGGGRRGRVLRVADRRAAVVAAQPGAGGRVRLSGRDPAVPGAGAAPAGRGRRAGARPPGPARRSTCATRPCSPRSTRARWDLRRKKLFLFAAGADGAVASTGWRTTRARRPSRSSGTCCSPTTPWHVEAFRERVPDADGPGGARAADAGLAPSRRPGRDGVTLVNIGVGPSNAKTITDHVAVLRPDADADDRALRWPAEPPGHRRLRAGHRVPAGRPRARRRAADLACRSRPNHWLNATCSTRWSRRDRPVPARHRVHDRQPQLGVQPALGARATCGVPGASRSTWSRRRSRRTGSATGCRTRPCCAVATSRCTAGRSCPSAAAAFYDASRR